MDLSAIAGFFEQSVPIGVVVLIVYVVKLDQNMKHIRELLSNHITDTNKKIDDTHKKIDQLSDRFDRLYELLLKK